MIPGPGDTAAYPEVERLRRLTEIGRALTYTTSLEQVGQLTVERGAALLDAAASVLMLPDADGQLHVRAASGVPAERVARFGAPDAGEVMERLQALLNVPDECLLAVPLVVGGSVTGVLAVALPGASTAANEWLLSALADQAAVALENARVGGEVRVEMEDRLRAIAGAANSKDRALATLAHDIRSPLGAIDGYCWNMADEIYGPITDQQRTVLGRIRLSGQHLLSLLDSVMDMARLNAGMIVTAAAPVHLADVAREAVDMMTPAATAKLQSLRLTDTDSVVMADQARVRQVLVNLIGNAIKFTPEKGEIRVATAERSIDGAAWGEIRVSDTGPGIALAEQKAIFEPYYRSEGTALAPGVGLGLAITQALVKQMGGVLDLQSEVGAGSTFVIRFPVIGAEPGPSTDRGSHP